jgi:serine/threonine-protein kinase RsbT
VIVTLVNKGDSRGIEVMVIDHGPGIADVATLLQDGDSNGHGPGMGLRGSRRLMDEFDIASEVGKGTVVTMKKWVV